MSLQKCAVTERRDAFDVQRRASSLLDKDAKGVQFAWFNPRQSERGERAQFEQMTQSGECDMREGGTLNGHAVSFHLGRIVFARGKQHIAPCRE